MLQSAKELENILACVRLTWDIEGDCVEAGVYEGGSAREIRKYMHPDKKLYLYDTFEGFKDDDSEWTKRFKKDYGMEEIENTEIIKGYFPDSAKDGIFSFVHLDMDTYESTRRGLAFAYPRMAKGGIILIHDYLNLELAVKEACEGYDVVTLGTSQGYIIK